ncbi:MAG: hypothetical protein ACKVPX_15220 [Myxococcaceae bacterium]
MRVAIQLIMRIVRWVFVALGLVGCGTNFNSTSLVITQVGELRVEIWEEDECPSLAGAKVTMNGAPLELSSSGGWVYSRSPSWGGSGRSCDRARWSTLQIPPETEAFTTFEIEMGDVRASAVFQNLFAQRSARVIDPPDAVVHPGQPIVVAWTPETDRFYATPHEPSENVAVALTPDDSVGSYAYLGNSNQGEVAVDDNRVASVMTALPFEGAGFLSIGATYGAAVVSCEGFGQCRSRNWEKVLAPVVLVP